MADLPPGEQIEGGRAVRHACRVSGLALIFGCLVATPASANVGYPTIAAVMPPLVYALLPIICIEAIVLTRGLGVTWQLAGRASAWANLCSAFAGVPVTWILLAMAQTATEDAGFLRDTPGEGWLAVLRQVAWFGSSEPEHVEPMLQKALLLMLVPFLTMSCVLEYLVIRKVCSEAEPARVRRVTFVANLLTHVGWVVAILAFT